MHMDTTQLAYIVTPYMIQNFLYHIVVRLETLYYLQSGLGSLP